jgi:hypothetical protein
LLAIKRPVISSPVKDQIVAHYLYSKMSFEEKRLLAALVDAPMASVKTEFYICVVVTHPES